MRLPIWRLEWRLTLRRRRLLILNTAIPLLLVIPISTGGAPAFHASAAYAVLFVLFGTFGSAIPLLREGEGGPLRRILLRGVSEPTLLWQRVLASTLVDCAEIVPAVLVILTVGGAGLGSWALLAPSLFIALLAANLVGAWVAAGARSIAEGALFAALSALFLLHGSGVFRTPAAGSWGARVENILPFTPLHEALFVAAGGGSSAVPNDLVAPLLTTGLFLGLTLLASRSLLDRISLAAP